MSTEQIMVEKLHDHVANVKSEVVDKTVDMATRKTELENDAVKPE